MSLKKIVGWGIVILLIFFIVTNPSGASNTISSIGRWLKDVGTAIITFLQGVTPGVMLPLMDVYTLLIR